MKVNIAAVQFKWKIDDYKDRATFQNRINAIMEDIREKTDPNLPLLVVFPEDIGTPFLLFNYFRLLSKKSTFTKAVRSLLIYNLGSVIWYKLRWGVSFIRALVLSKGSQMEKDYRTIFSQSAIKYNSYIVAGSITLPDFTTSDDKQAVSDRNVYNVSFFFGPDGSVIG
jgi:predicted amidohydrolase